MKNYPGGMAQMMKQVNQMQTRIQKLHEELNQKTYEASSGGGAVRAIVSGEGLVQELHITPEAQSSDTEMLKDLILTAINQALRSAKETSAQEMAKVTGGLSIPGLF